MNYDKMSVHELVSEAYSDGIDAGRFPAHLKEIESALRRKVIEEASVGVVKLVHNGVSSNYDIILHKETP